MKIGINAYESVVTRFGTRVGSSEYCFQLLCEFHKNRRGHEFFIYLPTEKTNDLPDQDDTWHYVKVKNARLWTLIALSKHLFLTHPGFDVFFSPTHYAPLFYPGKLAISIMDLSYLHFPQLFNNRDLWQLKVWTAWSIKKAQKIFTISSSTRDDIITKYRVKPEKISVTYLGLKSSLEDKKIKMDEIAQPFILFVGTIQPRKNITRLIEAFSRLRDQKIILTIVGKPGWQTEDIYQAPKKFGVEKRVKFLANVTDEELKVLYKNALLFVLPSLYEGFGLPILEAMSQGVPVITSRVSSLPEAGGDAAVYIDPQNVNDLTEKMEKVLSDKKLGEEMIKKGYEQVKKFSWEKTAQKTLTELEKIV